MSNRVGERAMDGLPQGMSDLRLSDGHASSSGRGHASSAGAGAGGSSNWRLGAIAPMDDDIVYHGTYEGDPNDAGHVITTTAASASGRQLAADVPRVLRYTAECVVGHGSFGVVFQAKCNETGDIVAIKKVLQDKRFKNRELAIMRSLAPDHPNVVQLRHCFYSKTEKDEVYLHLVLEYVPETVYRIAKHYAKAHQRMPLQYVQLYVYQTFRALGHLHAQGVTHRDIKPQNLLVDISTHQLKLCDFGSAKRLVRGEPNISYICSRYYRAPELIFGAQHYTTAIDVWSVGCVLAELLLGQPLFPGDSGVDQLVEIIKVLGTPSREEIHAMNPNYTEFKFPSIRAHPWSKVFHRRMPTDALDLVARLLVYAPENRIGVFDACADTFFDPLRVPGASLPNGKSLPPLYDWRPGELPDGMNEEVRRKLAVNS